MSGITIETTGGSGGTTNEPLGFGTFAMGLNVDGMEYGGAGAIPNVDYAIPTLSELQYYKSQGLDLIRLPISWATLQTALNGPLTASYISNIESVVANAASLGMKVILDVHDFGGYGGNQIGSAAVTDADFANLWTQLATAFAGNPGIGGYDLMNEPQDMPSATAWTQAAQAAITAIRTVDTKTAIIVEGNDYSNSQNWAADNPDLAQLHDPSNNLVFSAHLYLDTDDSGTHYDWATEAAAGDTTQIGVQRLEPFVAWLQANHFVGEIGELGAGNDNPGWLTALDNTLAYAQANNLPVTYWDAGPWVTNYPYSVEPENGVTAPQMAVLDKYSGDYPTLSVAALSGTADPDATVYLSENEVILATVQANPAGEWSDTLTGLANGIHIIVASENPPTEDGTIAATVFDLQAPQTVASGETLTVSNGDNTAPITVETGGTENVVSGGTVTGSLLDGGSQIVGAGGKATGTTINSGGTETVEAGALVSGSVIGLGGTELLTPGASVSGSIIFSGSDATLSIADPSAFGNVITGFDANGAAGDQILLAGITYSAGDTASLVTGNVLNVDLVGGAVYSFQLNPSESFAGDYFGVEASGQGLAIFFDPPVGLTLNAAKPVVSIAGPVNTYGIVGTYSIDNGVSIISTTIGAAVVGKAGTDFTVQNTGLLESLSGNDYSAGLVLGSAGTFLNTGTVIGPSGIEVFGDQAGAYVENDNILDATLGAGINLQVVGAALNTGDLNAAGTGLLLGAGGYGYNSGVITATDGIVASGATASYVYNDGRIDGTGGAGIELLSAGTAVNVGDVEAAGAGMGFASSGAAYNYGSISAQVGIVAAGAGAYAYNNGKIIGTGGAGIDLTGGGFAYNLGGIRATTAGIQLGAIGIVYNGGTITAATGITTDGAGGYVYNTGNIIATAGDGIDLLAAGSASNTGIIQAAETGMKASASGVLYNYGSITAATGILLAAGGAVYNYAQISGTIGVSLAAGGILTNMGTISGAQDGVSASAGAVVYEYGQIAGGTYAVSFASGGGRLVISAGASISGKVSGGGGTLELGGTSGRPGTIDWASDQFIDFATVQVAKDATWDLGGTFAFGAGTVLVNNGIIAESAADMATFQGAISGEGDIVLSAEPVAFDGSVAAGQTIDFSGAGQTLVLGDPESFAGKIGHFLPGDTISLPGISLGAITTTHFAAGVLTLAGAAGSLALTFTSPSGLGGDEFVLTTEGAGTAIMLVSPSSMSILTPGAAALASVDGLDPAFSSVSAVSPARSSSASPTITAALGALDIATITAKAIFTPLITLQA